MLAEVLLLLLLCLRPPQAWSHHPVSPWNQGGVSSGDSPWPGRDETPRRLEGLLPSGHRAAPGGHRMARAWQGTDVPTAPVRRLPSPFVLESLAPFSSFPVVLIEFHDREEMTQTAAV